MFLDEDCKSASEVMVEIADPFAAIVLWTPDETGRSDGKKMRGKVDMHSMWKKNLEGLIHSKFKKFLILTSKNST